MNALIFLTFVGLACAAPHFPTIVYNTGVFPFHHAGVVPTTYTAGVAPTPFTAGVFPNTYSHTFNTFHKPIPGAIATPYTAGVFPNTYSHTFNTFHNPIPVVYNSFAPIPNLKTVAAPVAIAPSPIPAPTFVGPIFNKFHAQAADGSYSFGYSGGPSSRHEIRDRFGVVKGAFNYVDPLGDIQSQQYVADAAGFRVAGTNLPVADLTQPEPVQETAEVKAARAEHMKHKITKRSADPQFSYFSTHTGTGQYPASTSPLIKTFYNTPTVYNAGFQHSAAPLTYSSNSGFPFTGFNNFYQYHAPGRFISYKY